MPKHTWGARSRVVCAVAACSLALVACGGDGDKVRDSKRDSASASPNDDLSGLMGGESTDPGSNDPVDGLAEALEGEVLVLDHGDGERVLLEIDPIEGQTSTSIAEMNMTTTSGGVEVPTIPMTMVTSMEVSDVAGDLFTLRATYDDISVDTAGMPRAMADELKSAMDALSGVAVTTEHDRSGAVLDMRFSLADNAPPIAHQMIEQIANSGLTTLSMPFPTEPVGVGASWQITDVIEAGPVSTIQTATYVLEEIDGSRYRLATHIEGNLEPGDAGAGVELVRGSTSGDGEASGTLDSLVPTSVESEISTTIVMEVAGRRLKTITDVEMSMTTE